MTQNTLHIIHLSHRIDRVELFCKELSDQNITDFHIWPGIMDHEKPYRGVSRAHKQIVRLAQKEKLPSVLIAEDDVKFTALGAYDYFLEKEPPSYDLYLGGISYGTINAEQSVKDFGGMMFYKINQKFYETFLSISEDGHLDRNLKNQGPIYCLPPIYKYPV